MWPNARTCTDYYDPLKSITLGTAKHAAFTDILRSIGYDARDLGNNLVDIYGIPCNDGNIAKLQKIRDAVERIAK